MKIDEGKVLIDTKINELERVLKKEKNEYNKEYFNEQVVPKAVSALIALIAEYFILNGTLSNKEKMLLQVPVIFYSFGVYVIGLLFHESYYYVSDNENKLERIKKIKKYLDNNINILDNVDVKDFEYYINNINDDLKLNNVKTLKVSKKRF